MTQCTISIVEEGGVLSIAAVVPDDAEGTIAAQVAGILLAHAQQAMNFVTGQQQQVQQIEQH